MPFRTPDSDIFVRLLISKIPGQHRFFAFARSAKQTSTSFSPTVRPSCCHAQSIALLLTQQPPQHCEIARSLVRFQTLLAVSSLQLHRTRAAALTMTTFARNHDSCNAFRVFLCGTKVGDQMRQESGRDYSRGLVFANVCAVSLSILHRHDVLHDASTYALVARSGRCYWD